MADQLASCATSPLVSHLLNKRSSNESHVHQTRATKNTSGNATDCRVLFLNHAAHFDRPDLTAEEDRFWTARSEEWAESSGLSSRIDAFLRSVAFVYEHNLDRGRHRVALNRFSDLQKEELPLIPSASSHGVGSESDAFDVSGFDGFSMDFWLKDVAVNLNRHNPTYIHLDSEDLILKLGKRIRRNRPQNFEATTSQGSITMSAVTPSPSTASSYSLNRLLSILTSHKGFLGIFDSWWWIGGGHGSKEQTTITESPQPQFEEHSSNSDARLSSKSNTYSSKSGDNSFVLDEENEMGGLEDRIRKGDGGWDTYLNWATEDNPDGAAIVHDAMDQSYNYNPDHRYFLLTFTSGSCWAVSALGSMEASIARNMAYMAYEEAYKHTSPSRYHTREDLRALSITAAQVIERQSIKAADLSVQELVDCDTRYDQGCAGGNPLLAFYFLHRFGVTSSANYPYTGKQGTCLYHKVDQPVATVETWGILTPDHENNMEKVLRYIGPVAVGLIGADPAFLAYKGGVFYSKGGKCDLGVADHAMLIVGYGEDDNGDGTKTKYWIARNSWGKGWGENGYIRMARIGGRKGSRGVCEIARSPSVALGGMFTRDVDLSDDYEDFRGSHRNSKGRGNGRSKIVLQASSEIESIVHRIRARLGFVQKGIMLRTLNGSEEGNDSENTSPLAEILGLMSILCFLTYVYRKRSRRQLQNRVEDHMESEDTSVLSHLSDVCVCNSAGSSTNISDGREYVGEDTALLKDCKRLAYVT
ncbi:hypothetical protein HJC23_005226 [Cyclotella cryptica]|uniref:Peptidase C1A papain C-terminal domain-containing protein n=1 Tax=Cyclotella cryptica TaxID=29204 RepID=A0ABD3NVA9_9STRA